MGRLVGGHGPGALGVDDLRPAQQDLIEQLALGPEIVVNQGCIDPGLGGHLSRGDAIEAVPGEQALGRIEDRLLEIDPGVLGRAPASGVAGAEFDNGRHGQRVLSATRLRYARPSPAGKGRLSP